MFDKFCGVVEKQFKELKGTIQLTNLFILTEEINKKDLKFIKNTKFPLLNFTVQTKDNVTLFLTPEWMEISGHKMFNLDAYENPIVYIGFESNLDKDADKEIQYHMHNTFLLILGVIDFGKSIQSEPRGSSSSIYVCDKHKKTELKNKNLDIPKELDINLVQRQLNNLTTFMTLTQKRNIVEQYKPMTLTIKKITRSKRRSIFKFIDNKTVQNMFQKETQKIIGNKTFKLIGSEMK
jgi:hypothetical protein